MAWTRDTRGCWLAFALAVSPFVAMFPASRSYSQGSQDGISFEEYRRSFPPAPVEVQAHMRDGKAVITWETPPAAASSEKLAYDPAIAYYRVYRARPDGDMSLIGKTRGTSFEDPAAPSGTTQRYVVTAVQRSGRESAPSRRAVLRIP